MPQGASPLEQPFEELAGAFLNLGQLPPVLDSVRKPDKLNICLSEAPSRLPRSELP